MKNSNNIFKIVIVVLLLLVIAVAGLGYYVISGNSAEAISDKVKNEEEHTVLLDEFIVNLKSDGTRYNYLKITIAPMFTNKKHKDLIEDNQIKIRDIITYQLRNCTAQEILDVEETKYLKEKMVANINEELGGSIVKDIYFTDIVVQ